MVKSTRIRRPRYSEAFNVILHLRGSVLVETLPVGLISLVLSVLSSILRKGLLGEDAAWFTAAIKHPFAIQVLGIVFGFLIAIRIIAAIHRWWEAINAVCQMHGLWYDAATMLMTFIKNDLQKMNLQRSRTDLNKEEVAWLTSRIAQLEEFRSKMTHWFSLMNATALSTLRYGEAGSAGMVSCKVRDVSSLLNAPKAAVANREDSGGSSFEFLGEVSAQEHEHLEHMEEQTLIIQQWIIEGLTLAQSEQLLHTSPALLSKVLDSILLGGKEYNYAYRLASIPYPFPLAQMMSFLMHAFILTMPFIVEKFTQAIILTPALAFLVAFSFWGLNAVAIQLESPFGEAWNILPLHDLNMSLNDRLTDLFKEGPAGSGTSVQTFSEVMYIGGGRLPQRVPASLAFPDSSILASVPCVGVADAPALKHNEKLIATEASKIAAAPAVVQLPPQMEAMMQQLLSKLAAETEAKTAPPPPPVVDASKSAASPVCVSLELQTDQLAKLAQLVSDGLKSEKFAAHGSSPNLSAQVAVPAQKPPTKPPTLPPPGRDGSGGTADKEHERQPVVEAKNKQGSSSADVSQSGVAGQTQPQTVSEHQKSVSKSAPQDQSRKRPKQPSPSPVRTGQQTASDSRMQQPIPQEVNRTSRAPANGPRGAAAPGQRAPTVSESQRQRSLQQGIRSPSPGTSAPSRGVQLDSSRRESPRRDIDHRSIMVSPVPRPAPDDYQYWEGDQDYYFDPDCPGCNEDLQRGAAYMPYDVGPYHPSVVPPYAMYPSPAPEYRSVVVPSGAIVPSSASSQSPRPIGQVVGGRPPSRGERSWPRARPPAYGGDHDELVWVAAAPEDYDVI